MFIVCYRLYVSVCKRVSVWVLLCMYICCKLKNVSVLFTLFLHLNKYFIYIDMCLFATLLVGEFVLPVFLLLVFVLHFCCFCFCFNNPCWLCVRVEDVLHECIAIGTCKHFRVTDVYFGDYKYFCAKMMN